MYVTRQPVATVFRVLRGNRPGHASKIRERNRQVAEHQTSGIVVALWKTGSRSLSVISMLSRVHSNCHVRALKNELFIP